jgi:hypothetical protein
MKMAVAVILVALLCFTSLEAAAPRLLDDLRSHSSEACAVVRLGRDVSLPSMMIGLTIHLFIRNFGVVIQFVD